MTEPGSGITQSRTNQEICQILSFPEVDYDQLDIDYDGAVIKWRRFGSGSPVVLIHGGNGAWLHWVRNIAALAQEYEVWVPDMPGYGESADLQQRHSFDDLVETMCWTLERIFAKRGSIDLVGFAAQTSLRDQPTSSYAVKRFAG
jgi:alpha-beta hydrolase superfamily lysophospholipase